MPKPQKVEAVTKLKERFEDSDAAILTEFRGLKVSEMKELRRLLAGAGTEFKVVKNTLGRIAAKEAQLDDLLPLLEGSTAIAFIKGDAVAAAKGIDEISKKYPALVIKGGFLDGKVFGADQAQALAKVKPREVILAQLAGLLQSPLVKLAGLLQAPLRDFGYALGAYMDKLEKESPAAAAPAATEAPAEEQTEAAAEEVTGEAEAPAAADATAEAPSEAPAEAEAEAPAEAESAAPEVEASNEAEAPEANAETSTEQEQAPEDGGEG